MPTFKSFICTLPDGGNGVMIPIGLGWQKYITMLSDLEVEEVRKNSIVSTVEVDTGCSVINEFLREFGFEEYEDEEIP